MAGVGKLDRTSSTGDGVKPDCLPTDANGTPLPIYLEGATSVSKTDCIHQLTSRIGAGLTLSITRARNLNYISELGLREFSVATSGYYDVDFTLDGVFAPAYCDKWLSNLFAMGSGNDVVPFLISNASGAQTLLVYTKADFSDASPVVVSDTSDTFTAGTGYYVALGSVDTSGVDPVITIAQKFTKPILGKDLTEYIDFVYGTRAGQINLFGYNNLEGPKYFDMGYQKINAHASGVSKYDGNNEIGVLLGCIVNSASISYDSGSDAGVKFSLSCSALVDYEFITTSAFDYSAILDPIPTDVFVGGCVSVFDASAYEPIAQTDSASVSIANNVTKLGNCLKLNYSSYALGSLTYDVSTTTYSNDPNKYLKYLYGYSADMTNGNTYFIGKQPVPIEYMKIRSDNTSATVSQATMFIDINMSGVYVGDMSNDYNIDSAIMDSPSLRAKKIYIAVGYKPSD